MSKYDCNGCGEGCVCRCRLCQRNREAAAKQPPRGQCVHLGIATGERRLCPNCRGHVEVKLQACAVHKACTTNKAVAGVACCLTCKDWRGES